MYDLNLDLNKLEVLTVGVPLERFLDTLNQKNVVKNLSEILKFH